MDENGFGILTLPAEPEDPYINFENIERISGNKTSQITKIDIKSDKNE
jgi:hypothetical protein